MERTIARINSDPHLTAFQKKVLTAMCHIPRGSVTTYSNLARAVNCGSAQAVGQAVKSNPYGPNAPCHRVIAGDLTIGGFSGKRSGTQITRKLKLLKKEGVTFTNGKIDSPELLCTSDELRRLLFVRGHS